MDIHAKPDNILMVWKKKKKLIWPDYSKIYTAQNWKLQLEANPYLLHCRLLVCHYLHLRPCIYFYPEDSTAELYTKCRNVVHSEQWKP